MLDDVESCQKSESPLAVLHPQRGRATKPLCLAQGAMLVEEEAPFATQVGEERLPRTPAGARGHALTGGEWHEDAVHSETDLQRFEEILFVAAPQFGEDQKIGVETHDVVEDPSRSTPSVDTSVKVERRDTHKETLGPSTWACGRLEAWTR